MTGECVRVLKQRSMCCSLFLSNSRLFSCRKLSNEQLCWTVRSTLKTRLDKENRVAQFGEMPDFGQWREGPYPRLHVPNVIAVLIEGDQPVFTNLKSSPEARGRNCGGGTAAFNVLRMEISEVRVM